MSTINSTSTLAQVEAAYDDNASYAEDGSAAKARLFMTACRILLRRLPAEAGTRESHVRLNPVQIQQELADAAAWVAANDGGPLSDAAPRVTRVSLRNSRG